MRDLARLDPEAIAAGAAEAWPLVRDADELHDALLSLVAIDDIEAAPWRVWLDELIAAGRDGACACRARELWTAAENWPTIAAAYPDAVAEPAIELPVALRREVARTDACVALVRGRMEHSGPATAAEIAAYLDLDESLAAASLEALEGQGAVLRGTFTALEQTNGDARPVEWCDRRLLARIHRLTVDGLRRRIQPVTPNEYLSFLTRHHRLTPENRWGGAVGVREAVVQLQGFELPAGAWSCARAAARVADYEPGWLDHLFLTGELVWGRWNPPKRGEGERPSLAVLSRVVPISLLVARRLGAAAAAREREPAVSLRPAAEQVLAALPIAGRCF